MVWGFRADSLFASTVTGYRQRWNLAASNKIKIRDCGVKAQGFEAANIRP
jgi:hypothetical protein